MTAQDVISLQVLWNRLLALVEEQATTLIRGSFSPAVREAGDIASGVFDRKGRMLAQAVTGTPGHVNSMATAVPVFLNQIPLDDMEPGDAYITNDPWIASGHLHDVTVVTPAFHRDRLVALFAATVHIVDVGGRGLGADGRDVFEEGICIPIMPLVRSGRLNTDLIRIFKINSREPSLVEGDLIAIASAGDLGARRLSAILDSFGVDDLTDLSAFITERSLTAMSDSISQIPDGRYENSLIMDGHDGQIRIAAALTVASDQIAVDYSGTDPCSSHGINVTLNYTAAYTIYGVKCLLAPEIPNNEGSMRSISVSAPPGCILNAQRPAPVSARHVVGHFLPDVMLGCLHKAVKQGAPAESAMMWNPYFRGSHDADGMARHWDAFLFNNGGMGARPASDGLSTTGFPSVVRAIPVEVAESVAPIVVWRKEFRPNSGGGGAFRGGLGQTVEVGALRDEDIEFSAMFDRIDNPAAGRDGGLPGAAGSVSLDDGTQLRGKGTQRIPKGRRLVMNLPGGGGYGSPADRQAHLIEQDIRHGKITPEHAQEVYGPKTEGLCRVP